MNKKAIVYARVSTINQDLKLQTTLGLLKAKELGYEDSEIVLIEDDGVSARKVRAGDRQGLSAMLDTLNKGGVKHLIVYDRDRLARNMIEYLMILKEIQKTNVEVVLTNSAAVPIGENFGLEAYLALFAENEGNRIAKRTEDARIYYPYPPFGYVKKGKKGLTHYEFSNESDINQVKELFKTFKEVKSLDEFSLFRRFWRSRIERDIIKILSNPFYSAHVIDSDGQLRKLNHVEQIVNIKDIYENINKIKQWEKNKIPLTSTLPEKINVPVYCQICGKEAEKRIYNATPVYMCKHGSTKKHGSIAVATDEIDKAIIATTDLLLESISTELIQKETLRQVDKLITNYSKQKNKLHYSLKERQKHLILNVGDFPILKKIFDQYLKLELELSEITFKESELIDVKKDLLGIIQAIKLQIKKDFSDNFISLASLLLHSIKIDHKVVCVNHLFAEFMTEVS